MLASANESIVNPSKHHEAPPDNPFDDSAWESATLPHNWAVMEPFPSLERKAFSGLALAILKAKNGESGAIVVSASGTGLLARSVALKAI